MTSQESTKAPLSPLRDALIAVALSAPFALGSAWYLHSSVDTVRAVQRLAGQVDAVSANTLLSSSMALDELPVGAGDSSPVIRAVAEKLGLHQIKPESFQHRLTAQVKLVAPLLGNQWAGVEPTPDDPVPGLVWREGTLHNPWGGTVTVYRNDGLMMVAFTNVPQELCKQVRPERSIAQAYLFACNDDLIAVEDNKSWHVDVPTLLKVGGSTSEQGARRL